MPLFKALSSLFQPQPPPPPQGFEDSQQQQQQQMPGAFAQRRTRQGAITKLTFDAEMSGTLVSVIVTINSGSSYDDLFSQAAQKVGEGERSATYLVRDIDADALQQVVEMGADAPMCQAQHGDAAQLAADLAAVEPAAVCFNWECCSGCEGDTFCGTSPVPLIGSLLARGFMVMVSDFSLSALIKQWDVAHLGANPFVKVGEFSHSMTLRFDSATLAACDDSAQLQILGELCETGEAEVHALSGTKAYTVDPNVRPVRVLTIVSQLGGQTAQEFAARQRAPNRTLCELGGGVVGLAGHCIVDFPGGGRLLASCPHWVELSRLDASETAVLAVARERYGETYCDGLQQRFEQMGDNQQARRAFASINACEFVQRSSAAKWVPRSRAVQKGGFF